MTPLPIDDVESAPAWAQPILRQAKTRFGFIPNILGKLANTPPALEAYLAISGAFERTSLSPVEQQVVLLAASYANRCRYCVSAHSLVASLVGAGDALIAAVRSGGPAADARLEALRRFTEHLVVRRGFADDEEVRRFLAAGFSKRQILEVILGITQKTLSNYTDHVEPVPVDPAFSRWAWTPAEPAAVRG